MAKSKPPKQDCPLGTDPAARAEADRIAAEVQAALPAGLSQPALRALAGAGIRTMRQLEKASQKELLALHGMGPKGVRIIKAALAERGKELKP